MGNYRRSLFVWILVLGVSSTSHATRASSTDLSSAINALGGESHGLPSGVTLPPDVARPRSSDGELPQTYYHVRAEVPPQPPGDGPPPPRPIAVDWSKAETWTALLQTAKDHMATPDGTSGAKLIRDLDAFKARSEEFKALLSSRGPGADTAAAKAFATLKPLLDPPAPPDGTPDTDPRMVAYETALNDAAGYKTILGELFLAGITPATERDKLLRVTNLNFNEKLAWSGLLGAALYGSLNPKLSAAAAAPNAPPTAPDQETNQFLGDFLKLSRLAGPLPSSLPPGPNQPPNPILAALTTGMTRKVNLDTTFTNSMEASKDVVPRVTTNDRMQNRVMYIAETTPLRWMEVLSVVKGQIPPGRQIPAGEQEAYKALVQSEYFSRNMNLRETVWPQPQPQPPSPLPNPVDQQPPPQPGRPGQSEQPVAVAPPLVVPPSVPGGGFNFNPPPPPEIPPQQGQFPGGEQLAQGGGGGGGGGSVSGGNRGSSRRLVPRRRVFRGRRRGLLGRLFGR